MRCGGTQRPARPAAGSGEGQGGWIPFTITEDTFEDRRIGIGSDAAFAEAFHPSVEPPRQSLDDHPWYTRQIRSI